MRKQPGPNAKMSCSSFKRAGFAARHPVAQVPPGRRDLRDNRLKVVLLTDGQAADELKCQPRGAFARDRSGDFAAEAAGADGEALQDFDRVESVIRQRGGDDDEELRGVGSRRDGHHLQAAQHIVVALAA